MSRLIDAEVAEKMLRAYADEVGCHRGEYELANGILKAVCYLENIPTSHDAKKVAEQLEEVGQKMSESKSIQKYGKSSPANHRYYKAVSVKRAIEIVKGGGVNE